MTMLMNLYTVPVVYEEAVAFLKLRFFFGFMFVVQRALVDKPKKESVNDRKVTEDCCKKSKEFGEIRMRRLKRYVPHILLILTQLSFSGWHIVGTLSLKDGADPLVFALYRELFSSIIMGAIVLYRLGPRSLALQIVILEYSPRLLLIGLCSFINVVGTVMSLSYISPTRYSIFQPSIPCIASVISCAVGLEKVTASKMLGILLAVTGAFIIEGWKARHSDSQRTESNIELGTAIVAVQVFAMANIVVFQKTLVMKFDPSLVTFIYYSIGTAITVLVCLLRYSHFTAKALIFEGHALPWLGLIYAAIFATIFAYNAYAWAGRALLPSITTVYCTLQPVGTAMLSFLLLGLTPEVAELTGGAVVVLGLLVTVYGNYRDERRLAEGQSALAGMQYSELEAMESEKAGADVGVRATIGTGITAAAGTELDSDAPREDRLSSCIQSMCFGEPLDLDPVSEKLMDEEQPHAGTGIVMNEVGAVVVIGDDGGLSSTTTRRHPVVVRDHDNKDRAELVF